jgi:hypothetical protein
LSRRFGVGMDGLSVLADGCARVREPAFHARASM